MPVIFIYVLMRFLDAYALFIFIIDVLVVFLVPNKSISVQFVETRYVCLWNDSLTGSSIDSPPNLNNN